MALQPASTRRPHAASVLLHPLWLASLATLALNDHVLKGSALLPDVVTGKLSDVAGMIVAPALLAAALGVRSRRGWSIAHVAVLAVFAAIKLSPPCAALWSALMGGFGFAWIIVVDPTDLLVAVPALVLGERVLRGALVAAPATLAKRSAQGAAAGVGLFCSVATSPPPEEPFVENPEDLPEQFLDITADVWLHNGTDVAQVVRIRQLRGTVTWDCGAVEADPGRLLDVSLFGDVESWTLPVDANMPVLDPESQGGACKVAWIDVDGFDPKMLFWRAGSPGVRTVPGSGFDATIPGGIAMELGGDDEGHFEGDPTLMFEPGEGSEPTGACRVQDDADRIDWGDDAPIGDYLVVAALPGVDGCTAVDLATAAAPDAASERLYLCTPEITLPFAVGDMVTVRGAYGLGYGPFEGIAIDVATTPARTLMLGRGMTPPSIPGLVIDAQPIAGCTDAVDVCGTVAKAAEIRVSDGLATPVSVSVGAPVVLDLDDGSRATIAVAHAQQRFVIDSECAAGPLDVGFDLEVAVLLEAAE